MARRAPFRTLAAALEELLDYISEPASDCLFEPPRSQPIGSLGEDRMNGVLDRVQQMRRFVGKKPETVKERNARRDRLAGKGR